MNTRHRISAVAIAAAVGLSPTAALLSPADASAATSCSVVWGSLAKGSLNAFSSGHVYGVRAGQHPCYDRVVIDITSTHKVGYRVQYVNTVYREGSGQAVPLAGGARLQVTVQAPKWGTQHSNLVSTAGYRTLRQVADAGSFEGQTTFGVGVRARLPFRTFVLYDGGRTRLVIDIAHHW